MGVQAIDQNIFPEELGKTKVFYCPRSTTEGNRTLWSFPISRGETDSVRQYLVIYPSLSKIISVL